MILGLVLIYFIGKSFYTLAEESEKSPWGFAILGIAVFYAGQIIAGFVIGLVLASSNPNADFDSPVWGLIAFPFGLLAWWGLHSYLKRKWSNISINKQEDVLDDVLLDD